MVDAQLQQLTESARQKVASTLQKINNARAEIQRIQQTTGSTSTSRALARQIDEDYAVQLKYNQAELDALLKSTSAEEAKSKVAEASSKVRASEIAFLNTRISQAERNKIIKQQNQSLGTAYLPLEVKKSSSILKPIINLANNNYNKNIGYETYINPITKQGISIIKGENAPSGYVKQSSPNIFKINSSTIMRGLKLLTTTASTDAFSNIKQEGTKRLRENLDILSGGQYSADYYNRLQNILNNHIKNFNSLYSGRTLSEDEYKQAIEISNEINYAQKVLDGVRGRITGFTETTAGLIKGDKLKSIAFGIISAGAGSLVSASKTPESIVTLIKNPSYVKDFPSSFVKGIKDSVSQSIQYIALNPYFGIARISTQIGIIYATGRLSAKGITLLKKLTPKGTIKIFKTLSKIPRKNLAKININIRKVLQKGKVTKVVMNIDGIGKGKIKGIAKGISYSLGKNKQISIAWGNIAKEGKFLTRKKKGFISGGVSISKKISSGVYESAGKGKSLSYNRIYLNRVGKIIAEYNLDDYVSNSISKQLNKNLAVIIGKTQTSAKTGAVFIGYIRDISKKIKIAIKNGSVKQLDDIYNIALKRFNENFKPKKYVLLGTKKLPTNYAVKQIIQQSTEQALKGTQAVIQATSSAVSRASRKLIKQGIKNVSKSTLKNSTKLLIKQASSVLIKGASIASVVYALNSAQAERQVIKLLTTPLSKQGLQSKQIIRQIQVPTQQPVLSKKIISPQKIKRLSLPLIPAIPNIPPTGTIRGKSYPGKPKNAIRVKGGYLGYVVVGRSKRAFRNLTRIPIEFDSSLNIASYFAMNYPTGYAVLKPSNIVTSKEAISRYPRVPKDFYTRNKNKLQIIKKKRSLIIKRK